MVELLVMTCAYNGEHDIIRAGARGILLQVTKRRVDGSVAVDGLILMSVGIKNMLLVGWSGYPFVRVLSAIAGGKE